MFMQEHEVNIAEAAMLMEILTDAGDSVMLWGKPGIGKSDIVHQLGAKKGRKVIEFHAALRETVDLRGIPVADLKTGKTRWLVPDELPNVERDGEEGYLFCDEINQSSPQMQSVLGGLILYGTIGDYKLPAGWRVVAAGNRVSDKAAAQRMPTHMRNRFAHLFITPDVDTWCAWANANSIAPEVVAFIRLRRELLHLMPKGDENAFPTPRSLTKAAKHVHTPKEYRMRLFASHIGDAVAAELDGFIELYRSLGSLDDIVNDPDNAQLPTESSIRFAVCTGLGRIATRKNFSNVIRYAKRLPRESEVLVVTDATGRDKTLKNVAAYGQWAVANQDLTLQN
jgi:MoxR-like ATPase